MRSSIGRVIKSRAGSARPHLGSIGGDGSEDHWGGLFLFVPLLGRLCDAPRDGEFEVATAVRAGVYVYILPRCALVDGALQAAGGDGPSWGYPRSQKCASLYLYAGGHRSGSSGGRLGPAHFHV